MNMQQSQQDLQPVETSTGSNPARKKGFMALAAAIVIAGGGYSAYWYFIGSRFVTTDNAYAAVEMSEVTPSVGGIVHDVLVTDTQFVHQGDVLVRIDDTDAQLALNRAEADFALAQQRVKSYFASDEGLSALVQAREADQTRSKAQLESAQADFRRAQIDFNRRKDLVKSGSVSGEELTNAQTALRQAQANLNAAEAAAAQAQANRLSAIAQKKANAAHIEGTTLENNPEVLQAKARLNQARVDFDRTVIRAPVDGVIAQRRVQVGKRVQIGAPLMAIVPIHHMHIDANFKEVDLKHVKIGQRVTATADLYGDDVKYQGVVTGLSGGTGSAFSMIPAQNATGNWIKVVQRLPVRIELDPQQLAAYPLQVGLSMEVEIDTDSQASQSVTAKASTHSAADPS